MYRDKNWLLFYLLFLAPTIMAMVTFGMNRFIVVAIPFILLFVSVVFDQILSKSIGVSQT